MHIYSPQWWKKGNSNHRSLDKELITSLSPFRFPKLKQFKYLSKIITPKEYRIMKILLVIVVANLAFLGWKGYSAHTVAVARAGGSYTEGLVGSAQYVNPVLLQNNDVDRDLVNLIYSGLLKYDAERKIVPDLADRYEMSADQKTYTFYLRKDVHWHDKPPLTADDVIFTFNKIQDSRVKSPFYLSYKDVRVEKRDSLTVQFILEKPFAPFLDLSTKHIIPAHLWKDVAPENYYLSQLNVKPVGTGMWKFKSFNKDKDGTLRSYTLVKNDDYYGAKPYLDKVIMKFYQDIDSAIQALKNGNVQGISFLPRDLRDRLVKNTGLHYYTFNLPQYTAVFFNQYQNADLKSKAVRQALAYAIESDRIVKEVLMGEGAVIHAPILPGFLGYDESAKQYTVDLAKAAGLLEAAGWKKDDKGMYYKDERGTPVPKNKPSVEPTKHYLKISLVTINVSENTKVAEIIRQGWTALGVTADVQLVDPTQIKNEVIDARNYQALLYGEIIGSDPDLYPFWHSSQARAPGLNLAVFSNDSADALLEAGRQIADVQGRAEKYKKFQDILSEELPAIFLYNPTYNYVVSSRISGVSDKKQIVYPSDRFVDIAQWYTKSKRVWKK